MNCYGVPASAMAVARIHEQCPPRIPRAIDLVGCLVENLAPGKMRRITFFTYEIDAGW